MTHGVDAHQHFWRTVGDTPCIRINKLAPNGVRIYAKAEAFNRVASVKDRLALDIIEATECNGPSKPRQTLREATSGNTGIGLPWSVREEPSR